MLERMKTLKLNHKYHPDDSPDMYYIVREDRNTFYIVDYMIHDLLTYRPKICEIDPVYEIEKTFCRRDDEQAIIDFLRRQDINI